LSRYIWQLEEWPEMVWRSEDILQPLGRVRRLQGMLYLKAESLGLEFVADQLENEAFSTAAIENSPVDRASLRSSIAGRLGIDRAAAGRRDRYADGLVEMLLDATMNYRKELTAEKLKSWQASLFPTGYSGLQKIAVGEWRTGLSPMQVVSGVPGYETVHFEAPPSDRIQAEISGFLHWFNESHGMDGLIKAAKAHLYFVTIHPFEDGNGRVARSLTDMALAQDEKNGKRMYSFSSQILAERGRYYEVLEEVQRGNGDITQWLIWFFECMRKALSQTLDSIGCAERVGRFWLILAGISLSERQRKVVRKLSQYGPEGFEGYLTNRKYRALAKTTRETAKRDLADLLEKGVIRREPGGGRSVSYSLVWPGK